MSEDIGLSPFPIPQGARIIEYPRIEDVFGKFKFNDGLLAQFKHQSTFADAIKLFTPIQEPEFGIYVDSLEALRISPRFLGQNPTSTISDIADRNYQYITFAIAHNTPDHPLNHDYMMQWRIEVDVNGHDIDQKHIRFCIKSRDKSGLMRDEWETDMNDYDVETAIKKVIAENAENMPKDLPAELLKSAHETFVSGHSATSRSGYNGFQWRKKWQSTTLHNFSSDVQIVGTRQGLISRRHEIEDEVRAIFGNPILLTDNFERVAKGALDVHRGQIITGAKHTNARTMKSSLSKAAFAEHATQGAFDKSSIQEKGWKDNVIPISDSREAHHQVGDYFHDPALKAGLMHMLQALPPKGSIFSPHELPTRQVA
ncbi:MAG: hypothetical protein GW778_02145 [Alphaproteobacteria bacterium]|nr:hypothetical protein [Alphaproteobacteria bacterium]